MRVVGATIVRDALRLEYPIIEAIKSVLPLVDEMVVNVGRSDDGTFELLVSAFAQQNVVVLDRDWDLSEGGAVLAQETNIAMRQSEADWVVYIQADEVLHEDGIPALQNGMSEYLNDERVEGLLVDFVHHYGLPEIVATSRTWYRREVRIVKTNSGAASYHEAQGFRTPRGRIRAAKCGARYHHYGWVRSAATLEAKSEADFRIYGRKKPKSVQGLPWEYALKEFLGSHPEAVRGWLEMLEGRFPGIESRSWNWHQLRMLVSDVVERSTGKRIFEYRNYDEVVAGTSERGAGSGETF
jgi:glycosyltransferase involved in cell wall biosynthesis